MFHFTVEKYIDRMFSGVRNRKPKSNLALKIDERAHKTRKLRDRADSKLVDCTA